MLAARAAAGDAAAFAALVRAHEGSVRRFLARLSGGEADDLAQDVFLTAWRKAGRYDATGSYRGWLFRIGYHAFLDARRSGLRRELREQQLAPDAAVGDLDLSLDLNRALATLSGRERAAALLCFAEGCSHGEAAAIMQVPLGTLKSILARARAALVRQLETANG